MNLSLLKSKALEDILPTWTTVGSGKHRGQFVEYLALGHDECPVFCPGLITVLKSRRHQVANDAKTISGTTGNSSD